MVLKIFFEIIAPGKNTNVLTTLRPKSRATGPVGTSIKEEKHTLLPTTLNFDTKSGKLRIYTLPKPPEVF